MLFYSFSHLCHSWDPCPLNTIRSGPILHEGFIVRDQTKTINQERTRVVLWPTVLRKPLKLISSHSIFFDLTCSRVTSNQGHPTRTRVHKNDSRPTLSARAREPEFDNTPEIPFLLYFSYNTSPYGSLILDWQDTRDTCVRDNRGYHKCSVL